MGTSSRGKSQNRITSVAALLYVERCIGFAIKPNQKTIASHQARQRRVMGQRKLFDFIGGAR